LLKRAETFKNGRIYFLRKATRVEGKPNCNKHFKLKYTTIAILSQKIMKRKRFFTAGIIALIFSASLNAQVGINTDNPQTTLDIVQQDQSTKGKGFRLDDGNQGAGRVLVSDADGVGTWGTPIVTLMQLGKKKISQDSLILFFEPDSTSSSNTYTGTKWVKSTIIRRFVTDRKLFVDTASYIDLKPGVWRVDLATPFAILPNNDTVTVSGRQVITQVDSLNYLTGLVGLTTDITANRTSKLQNPGAPYPPYYVYNLNKPDLFPCIQRPSSSIYIYNTENFTQRYYVAFSAAEINYTTSGIKNLGIIWAPISKTFTFHASPMSTSAAPATVTP
jgi:hypothetical protein